MSAADTIAGRIDRLDLSLFDGIDSQSSDEDKTGWLAVQRCLRQSQDGYVYLEIGSHLGGSIQQHLVDPKCRTIYSIDKRPLEGPDDRGTWFRYDGNSTQRMLDNLRSIDAAQLRKVVCIDADASEVDPGRIETRPAFCFIDAEHTHTAALSDFGFCLSVCSEDAVIGFHDDWLLYPAISEILDGLERDGVPFRAFKLPGATFLIALRSAPVLEDEGFLALVGDGRRSIPFLRMKAFARRLVPQRLRPYARKVGNGILRSGS